MKPPRGNSPEGLVEGQPWPCALAAGRAEPPSRRAAAGGRQPSRWRRNLQPGPLRCARHCRRGRSPGRPCASRRTICLRWMVVPTPSSLRRRRAVTLAAASPDTRPMGRHAEPRDQRQDQADQPLV